MSFDVKHLFANDAENSEILLKLKLVFISRSVNWKI